VSTAQSLPDRPSRASLKEILRDFPNLVRLLYRLIRDARVSKADKAILAGILLYVINPMDLIPDLLPVLGQIDDAYLVALGFLRLLNRAEPGVVEEHWEGQSDIRELLHSIIRTSVFYLPARARTILLGKSRLAPAD